MTVAVAPDLADDTERAEPGLLELDLVRAADGRTRVARWAQRFPQRVTAPMYVDDAAPGAAYLCVQNPTGGLFPGDHLRTRVRLATGAGLQLGGQSATIVYGGGPARQSYDFVVADGAVLEHVPGTTIPHPDAELYQRSRVRLDGDAVYLGWERLASGRIARGERHAYRLLDCRTEVVADGRCLAVDTLRLDTLTGDPDRPGVTGGHDYVVAFVIAAPRRPDRLERLADELAVLLDASTDPVGAVSSLPGGAGLVVRVLGTRAPAVLRVLATTWLAARRTLADRPGIPQRILR